jgi:3',5'-cyclic AMP phosphodiesterase CpdA
MPFLLAHVSDLHVSPFGDTLHDRSRLVHRSARKVRLGTDFETCWSEADWRVVRRRGRGRRRPVLLDPEGYVHALSRKRKLGAPSDPVERGVARARRLEASSARALSAEPPSDERLAKLLEASPRNVNLRLLTAARFLADQHVDAVVVTGDCTDDGDGWELVQAAFARWNERGRLFAIPGNHDLFLFPIGSSARPKPTRDIKRARWQEFAGRIDLDLEPCGAWMRVVPEADAMIVGLDSCALGQKAFFRQNGAIGPAQLGWLRGLAEGRSWRDVRHRVVLVHHHVVPLQYQLGHRPPTEIGMRLDDARAFTSTLADIGATLVMHGHRHISERRHPAGYDFDLFAAPSLTLGCNSGDAPSYWAVELDHRVHAERVRIPNFEAFDMSASRRLPLVV